MAKSDVVKNPETMGAISISKEEFERFVVRDISPRGVINDLFVMLRFVKDGTVPFVWAQVNAALARAEELSAADPVRWRRFLKECNKVQPGSIPGAMLQ
jgi:hypothetical protein